MSHLYDRVAGLADLLAGFTDAPVRSRDERAVYDAWRIALKPRASRMLGRVERVADPVHWEFDEEREPELLRPSSWTLAVREFASLYTELVGAALQHGRMRIVWSPKTRFGIQAGTSRAPVHTKTKAKEVAAAKEALEKARRAKMRAAKLTLDSILKRLEVTRATLAATLDETKHCLAALQRAEETRLDGRIDRLAEGTRAREKAEDHLLAMARGRLKASRYRDDRPAGYGSLLRSDWLRPHGRLVRLLEGA